MPLSWEELEHLRPKEQWRYPLPPMCRHCHYILTGLPSRRCPECGTAFNWQEVRQRTSQTWAEMLQLTHANEDARTGLRVVLGGWAAMLIFRLPFLEPVAPIIDVAAIMTGIVAIFLGAQVFRICRVPAHARPYLGRPLPKMSLGAGVIFLALALVAATFLAHIFL